MAKVELQARLVPRPVRLRPHLTVTPRPDDRAARPEPRPSDGDGTPIPTQTGCQQETATMRVSRSMAAPASSDPSRGTARRYEGPLDHRPIRKHAPRVSY